MATKNGFIINLLVDDTINKIEQVNDTFETRMYNESKYMIKITNLNNELVDAYLKIDGKKMGAYRIIPNETIDIIRPFRRRKDLYFLHKKNEYQEQKLFNPSNKKLGCIEVDFMTGELYPKDEEIDDCDYRYNKQVYRLVDYEYKPEFMNIYKRINKPKYNSYYLQETSCPVYNPYEESKPDSNPSQELYHEPEPEPEPEPESMEVYNSLLDEKKLGFTTYGNSSPLRYKIYQALDYDGKHTLVKLYLYSKLKFEAL